MFRRAADGSDLRRYCSHLTMKSRCDDRLPGGKRMKTLNDMVLVVPKALVALLELIRRLIVR